LEYRNHDRGLGLYLDFLRNGPEFFPVCREHGFRIVLDRFGEVIERDDDGVVRRDSDSHEYLYAHRDAFAHPDFYFHADAYLHLDLYAHGDADADEHLDLYVDAHSQ
jgi:hypothetical protein